MIIGQAAGIAASLVIQQGIAVQEVSVRLLQEKLKAGKAVLQFGGCRSKCKSPC